MPVYPGARHLREVELLEGHRARAGAWRGRGQGRPDRGRSHAGPSRLRELRAEALTLDFRPAPRFEAWALTKLLWGLAKLWSIVSNSSVEDTATIARLETEAAKLRAQLDAGFAKRPLIIEFSGLPKSGKTRSISILELFLKRNGFKVDVFIERASIAPIRTKGHLNFNTWVSCASLQGMLEALSKPELDIFILDRGVFDALVWTHWLAQTGKVTKEEAEACNKFFAMSRWTDLVDLVLIMTCDPSTSTHPAPVAVAGSHTKSPHRARRPAPRIRHWAVGPTCSPSLLLRRCHSAF